MPDWWYELSHDNQTVIVVFAVLAVTGITVTMLIVLHDALLRAGI